MTNHKLTVSAVSLSRRQSLKLFAMMAAGAAMPGCALQTLATSNSAGTNGHWPTIEIKPIQLTGYGKDPNLIMPPASPWPKTLTDTQLKLVSLISDVLVPAEDNQPGALGIGAPSVVDEWISAPYKGQQRDRDSLLRLFIWLDDEAIMLYKKPFLELSDTQQMHILNSIAFGEDSTKPGYEEATRAFDRLRELVLAAYFCSIPGSREIGYQGNVAIAGDYPGPTKEAYDHLETILDELDLSKYAYSAQ